MNDLPQSGSRLPLPFRPGRPDWRFGWETRGDQVISALHVMIGQVGNDDSARQTIRRVMALVAAQKPEAPR